MPGNSFWAWLRYLPHLLGLYIAKSVCDYLIRKSEHIAADSLGELLLLAWRQLSKGKQMVASKQFPLGPVTLGLGLDDAGQAKASVAVGLEGSLGGGAVAGALKGKLSVAGEIDLETKQVADLGIGALELVVKSSPLAVAALEALKVEVDKVLAPAAPSA